MRSQLLKLILLGLLSAGLLAACQRAAEPEQPPAGQALEGAPWRMESYMNASGITVETLPAFPVTAIFQAGALRGSDGCNQYFASYQTQGNQIKIQTGGTTQMACEPPEVMEQAAGYQMALGFASSFAVESDTLTLYNGEAQPVVRFSRQAGQAEDQSLAAPAAPASPLEGSWLAVRYDNGKQSGVAMLPGTSLTAVFDPYGKLTGESGCNRYQALYEVMGEPDESGDTPLQIWAATTSQVICTSPQGIMEQEQLFLAALQQTAAYRLVDEELILLDARGRQMARLMRR